MAALITAHAAIPAARCQEQQPVPLPKDAVSDEGSQVKRKARIAVVPAVFAEGIRTRLTRDLEATFGPVNQTVIEDPGFTGHIVDALVNTRKFEVLERQAILDVLRELRFSDSSYVDNAKLYRLGVLAGAEYIVIPEILFIHVVRTEREIPYVPKMQAKYQARMATRVRVVRVMSLETGEIVSSSIDESDYSETADSDDAFRSSFIISFFQNLYRTVAAKEVEKIINLRYPITIVSTDGTTVTLNRGEGLLQPGDTLEVFQEGSEILDPETRERLGFNDTYIGAIRVVSVREKTAIAETCGDTGPLRNGLVCRRKSGNVFDSRSTTDR